MGRFSIYQSTQDSIIHIGRDSSRGHETPKSRLCICVTEAYASGEKMESQEVQLWLTIPQVAEIVKLFFAEIVSPKSIFTSFLRRLIQKRWAVMSSDIAKRSFGEEGPWFPSYHEVPEDIAYR